MEQPNEGFPDSVNRALEIGLIREMIIDHFIHDGKDVLISNVLSCRLVNKTWFQSTLTVLRNAQQPLLRFSWEIGQGRFFIGEKHLPQNGNPGDFLRSLKASDSGHVPPHAIEASAFFFYQQNFQSFWDHLVTCGSSLVELNMGLNADGGTIPIQNNNNILLPKLRAFGVRFLPIPVNWCTKPDDMVQAQAMFDLIKLVLEASNQLKSFKLICMDCLNDHGSAPKSIINFLLPPSLVEIELCCTLIANNLEILVSSPLPKLKKLLLNVNCTRFENSLITRILKNVRKTLEVFHITEENVSNVNKRHTAFQLPLMEKLKTLKIGAAHLELGGCLSSLQEFVPVLTHVTLKRQTNSMFRKWTEQSTFPCVKSLNVSFFVDDFSSNQAARYQRCFYVDVELRTMKALYSAFPNLQELDITLRGTQLSALELLMREMRNLQKLRIDVKDGQPSIRSDAWDAIFIGIPVETVAELRAFPALWQQHVLPANSTSIRNLADLHTLELTGGVRLSHVPPIISDVAFHFAFFKMPKLTNLILKRGFSTTRQIKKKWEKQGRRINSSEF